MENIKKYIPYLLLGLLIYFCSHLTVNAESKVNYSNAWQTFSIGYCDSLSCVNNGYLPSSVIPNTNENSYFWLPPNDATNNKIYYAFSARAGFTGFEVSSNKTYKIVLDFKYGGLLKISLTDWQNVKCGLFNGVDYDYSKSSACTSIYDTENNQIIIYATFVQSGSGISFSIDSSSGNGLVFQTQDAYQQGIKFTNATISKFDEGEQLLINITNAINNQIDVFKKFSSVTNEKLEEINNYLTDDSDPSSDISSLGNVQGLLPPGPVDSLLNIPFEFMSILVNSLSGTCVPLSGTFVFDKTFTIPCFESLYDEFPSSLMIFIDTLPSAFLLIKYFKNLYKKVDRAVSLETSADDEWGCL